jgi:hypothetical protein
MQMLLELVFVQDGVLPETTLPDIRLAMSAA